MITDPQDVIPLTFLSDDPNTLDVCLDSPPAYEIILTLRFN